MAREWSDAPEVKLIAQKLIEIFKPELDDWGYEIRYIFNQENPKHGGMECVALARKITGLAAYLAGYPEGFFVMEVGIPTWSSLSLSQQIAVVHHELLHFGIDENGGVTLIPHDIEEFSQVAEVHGAYFDRLQVFADAVEQGNSDSKTRDEIIDDILRKL